MEQEESEAAPEKDAETTDETLVGTDNSMEDVTGDDRAVNSKEEPARAEQVNQDSDDSSHSKGATGSHLSPEEKDRYAFISEQLNILNNDVNDTPTRKEKVARSKKAGSSKGPLAKLWSPLKRFARGIKRTRRKSPGKAVKKLKLQSKEETEKCERPLKQSDFENQSDGDSSSDEDQWRIFEGSEEEEEIDKKLEDKADSFKLSALNVKSILHKIITDEHVLKMVQNSVDSSEDGSDYDGEDQGKCRTLAYEPKMTRSKVKDFLQKQGMVPHPWGLSPVKNQDSPSFLDIDLPEDEEDEDFDPDKVPAAIDSDEDSESVLSSNVSDLGSPMPSTPRTPCVTPSLSQRLTDNEDSQSLLSPMGPPTQLPRSCNKSLLGKKYQDAVEADEATRKKEEEELIALRTRSKCSLIDTSILELEANFVAPDITLDMYETKCNDQDWNYFLHSLTKGDATPEDVVKDGEDDDPEYNYLEEADQEYDKEDFRDDRAVKVSKRELTDLLDELYDAYGEVDPIDLECKSAIKAQTRQIVQQTFKEKHPQSSSSSSSMTDHERKQIDDQMRKHVQLLTQMFVLCQDGVPQHTIAGAECKMLLNELHTFATRQEAVNPNQPTALRACTLDAAVSLINDPDLLKDRETSDASDEKIKKAMFKCDNLSLPPLSFGQMEILWSSPVFMYPHLLPHGGLFKSSDLKRDRSRVRFLECEDNLLALGLEQFKAFRSGRDLIQQLLLPTKSRKQLSIRIKNLSAKVAKDNPVKYYRVNKRLPAFPQYAPDFDITMMKAPKDQGLQPEAFPSWCRVLYSPSKDTELCCSNSDCIKRRSASKTSLSGSSQGGSAPATPLGTCTDSSQAGSSGSSNRSLDMQILKKPGKRRLYNNMKKSPVKGSFLPLKGTALTGAHMTEGRVSPITIYVVDRVPVTPSSVSVTQPVSSAVVTCVTPTIVLVNSSQAMAGKGNAATTTTQSIVSPSAAIISRSTPDLSEPRDNTEGSRVDVMQSRSTPDLQRENLGVNCNADGNAVPEQEPFNEMPSTSLQESKNDNFGDMSTSENRSRSDLDLSSRNTNDSQISMDLTVVDKSENQSSDKTDSVVAMATTLSVLPADAVSRSTPDFTRSATPTNENNISVIAGHCTPVLLQSGPPSRDSTPNSGQKSNSGTPVSKSALEIMASYAPYFVSPSTLTNQEPKCRCSSERKYRPVVPKLLAQSTGKTVSPFLDKIERTKTNPRRQKLQQKARSILPKGFVLNTYSSPTKKAASSLVDRAKGMKSPRGKSKRLFSPQKSGGAGLRRILPNPFNLSKSLDDISGRNSDADVQELDDDIDSQKDTASEYDTQESEFMSDDLFEAYDNDEDFETAEENENYNANALDEKSADTESDDTQSEDGNETQEDGDSQEENMDVDDDEHLATLMEASTTLRFKPTKVTGGLSSLKAKRHRHKDVTLAMLAPDIIESDPSRDYRDTAFAQAYLLKVKKVLREDLDKYEQFLRIMYEFNKTCQSPVKLYTGLTELFTGYTDLLHDFAGFLLPAQAVECGCFLSHQEFVRARSFLRKLEIYFSKTPSQFQKIMKVFSRWNKKPSRKLEDLRSQVEPMLRGQRYLLQEFSLFFPNDKPPESAADDFEEIDFEKSDDETKFDGFEEVELPEEREPLGTKRCQCKCHSTGDDNYRKRKKHCNTCGLTVMDGELVFRINSKTIKKVNVRLGPPIKPQLAEKREPTDTNPALSEEVDMDNNASVEELSDNEAAEKENIENFEGTSQKAETARARVANKLRLVSKNKSTKAYQGLKDFYPWKKSTFLQRISTWSRKSKYSTKTSQGSSASESKPPSEQNSNDSTKSQEGANEPNTVSNEPNTGANEPNTVANEPNTVSAVEPICTSVTVPIQLGEEQNMDYEESVSSATVKMNDPKNSKERKGTFKDQTNTDLQQEASDIAKRTAAGTDGLDERPVASSSDSLMASDILGRAFKSAMLGEVSMDSTSILSLSALNHQQDIPQTDTSQNTGSILQGSEGKLNMTEEKSFGGSGPEGQNAFMMSSDSSFSKIKKSGSSGFLLGENSEEQINSHGAEDLGITETVSSQGPCEPEQKHASDSSLKEIIETSVSSPFSPFSPFAQEIQTITSVKSPFACIKSPNKKIKRPTTPKFRRITPIPVKGHNISEDESSSAFQALAQNSPLIEDSQLKSPFDKSNLERQSSSESLNKISTTPVAAEKTDFAHVLQESGDGSEDVLQPRPGSASNSQRSMGTSVSLKSSESLQSGSLKSSISVESGSLKSDVSEQRKSPVVISHPVTHSEDANEGFIKPVISDVDIALTGGLSEKSLFSLGSNLGGEHLHTISNLTNILSALEHPVNQSNSDSKYSNSDNQVRSIEMAQAKSVKNISESSEHIQSVPSKENLERLKMLDIKVSRLSDSEDSCSRQLLLLNKQQKDAADNISRNNNSESLSNLSCDSNTTKSYQLDFSTFSDKSKEESPPKTKKRYSGDKLSYLDDTTVVESIVYEPSSITTETQPKESRLSFIQNEASTNKTENGAGSKTEAKQTHKTKKDLKSEQPGCSEKAKKAKSSKLSKSPLKEKRSKSKSGTKDKKSKASRSDKKETVDNSGVKSSADEKKTGDQSGVKSNADKKETEDNSGIKSGADNKKTENISGVKSSADKKETEDNSSVKSSASSLALDLTPGLPDLTNKSSGKVSNAAKKRKSKSSPKTDKMKLALVGKAKSKLQITASVKTGKIGTNSKDIEGEPSTASSEIKEKVSKSKKHVKVVSTLDQRDLVSIDTSKKSGSQPSVVSDVSERREEEPEMRLAVEASKTRRQAETMLQPEPSSSSVDDSSTETTEELPTWTKAMDQIIIEGCRLHGPKEKTFSRIAKLIGRVTAQQVQKRFQSLCALLLESGSESEG